LLARITDMLDFSKIESGEEEIKISKFLLKDILRSSIAFFNKEVLKHNIKISLEIERDADIEIEADSTKLMHIMFKLLSNAMKFTIDGGSVFVQARKVTSDKLQVSSEKQKVANLNLQPATCNLELNRDFIEISVTDTGIGIKPEDMSKLFQVFSQIESPYQKRYAGTGLGLVLTKKLIELHGGKIWVESEIGEGSRFAFVIPVTQIASR
jgi:signal transduction histidine kinase